MSQQNEDPESDVNCNNVKIDCEQHKIAYLEDKLGKGAESQVSYHFGHLGQE